MGVVIAALIVFSIYTTLNKKKELKYVNDTITIVKKDTFKIEKPIPYLVTKHSTKIDTLLTTDSIPVMIPVQVPISLYQFKDTAICDSDSIIINQSILGYGVKVESVTASLKMTSKVIVPIKIVKPKRFSFGPYFGATIYNNKIIPSIGIGLQYKIFEF